MPVILSGSAPRIVPANRRTDVRVRAVELEWLREARLADGPSVSLIDLSLRGASFEIARHVRPGDAAALELVTDGERTISTSRIVRSEIALVRPDFVRYRGACVFAAPLPWNRRFHSRTPVDPVALLTEVDYQPWGGWSDCVVWFRHGRRLNGCTWGFQPHVGAIDMWPSRTAPAREKQLVPLSLVRAIHFLRDLDDGGKPVPVGDAARQPPGTAVEVAFRNNQIIRGTIPSYNKDQPGFWLLSVNRNEPRRVFAVSSAVAEIRVFCD